MKPNTNDPTENLLKKYEKLKACILEIEDLGAQIESISQWLSVVDNGGTVTLSFEQENKAKACTYTPSNDTARDLVIHAMYAVKKDLDSVYTNCIRNIFGDES